jgi:hypothetical protein
VVGDRLCRARGIGYTIERTCATAAPDRKWLDNHAARLDLFAAARWCLTSTPPSPAKAFSIDGERALGPGIAITKGG